MLVLDGADTKVPSSSPVFVPYIYIIYTATSTTSVTGSGFFYAYLLNYFHFRLRKNSDNYFGNKFLKFRKIIKSTHPNIHNQAWKKVPYRQLTGCPSVISHSTLSVLTVLYSTIKQTQKYWVGKETVVKLILSILFLLQKSERKQICGWIAKKENHFLK